MKQVIKEHITPYIENEITKQLNGSIDYGNYFHSHPFPRNENGDTIKILHYLKPTLKKRLHNSQNIYSIALKVFVEYMSSFGYTTKVTECSSSNDLFYIEIRWDNREFVKL